MGKYIKIGFRNLTRHKLRTLLTSLVILLGSMLLILTFSLSDGIYKQMLTYMLAINTGQLRIVQKEGDSWALKDKQQIHQLVQSICPEIDYYSLRYQFQTEDVRSRGCKEDAEIIAVDIDKEKFLKANLKMITGSFDVLKTKNKVIVCEELMDELDVKLGDEITILYKTPQGQLNSIDVIIAAVCEDASPVANDLIIMNSQAAKELTRLESEMTLLYYFKDNLSSDAMQNLKQQIMTLFSKNLTASIHDGKTKLVDGYRKEGHEYEPPNGIFVLSWEDQLEELKDSILLVDILGALANSVLFIVIGFGIMLTIWLNSQERIKEIGTLKAIGMKKGGIRLLFIFEALTSGLISTVIGILLGVTISYLIDSANIKLNDEALKHLLGGSTLRFHVNVIDVGKTLFVIPVLTIFGALFPAIKASSIDAIKAIHHIN